MENFAEQNFRYDLISESDYSAEQLQQRGRMFAAVMYLDLYSKNLLNTDWDIQKEQKNREVRR